MEPNRRWLVLHYQCKNRNSCVFETKNALLKHRNRSNRKFVVLRMQIVLGKCLQSFMVTVSSIIFLYCRHKYKSVSLLKLHTDWRLSSSDLLRDHRHLRENYQEFNVWLLNESSASALETLGGLINSERENKT